jgi:hypothetical protein
MEMGGHRAAFAHGYTSFSKARQSWRRLANVPDTTFPRMKLRNKAAAVVNEHRGLVLRRKARK